MARKDYGSLASRGVVRQPEGELQYDDTGLVDGQLVYALDEANWSLIAGMVGSAHPDDPNVTLFRVRRRMNRLGITQAVFDCIGISKDPTDRVVSYPASVTTEPIETHKGFVTTLAGTSASPKHGAAFDEVSEVFLGFVQSDAPQELRGVRSYYSCSVVCRATYYTRTPPKFSALGKITGNIPNVPEIAGVVNWLRLAPSSEQIGTAKLWRVTEEFIGSGANGWSEMIYGE